MLMQYLDTEGNAPVGVLVGGMPHAAYNISASLPAADGQWQREFTRYTDYFDACAGQADPVDYLLMQALYPANINGQSILAAKAGTALNMRALLTHLHEGQEINDVQISCGGVSTTCEDVVGTGLFVTRTDYQDGKVTFGALEGAASVAGDYRAQYALAAGVNLIDIKGSATVSRSEVVQTCTSGCSVVEKDKLLESGTSTLKAYGVEIQLADLPVMVLDGDGLTVGDYEVPYTIVPAEYTAGSAVVYVYQDSGLIEVLPAEVSGQGFIKFASGSHFDVESDYEIEVVLNEGSSSEIKTDRKPLMIGQVKLVSDEDAATTQKTGMITSATTTVDTSATNVKELKYSRGDISKKVYRIEIKRNDKLLEQSSCDQFRATLKTLSKKGVVAIVPPGEAYPKAEINIRFKDRGGYVFNSTDCISVMSDSDEPGKFIITNMKQAELTEMKQGVTPLYGGIGSKLTMRLHNDSEFYPVDTTREYAIEPIGVILIGIDGMRQDVLYADGERYTGFDDTYHVPADKLTGLCEVLGGKYGTTCDIAGMDDKHIKMQNVTAIFPSITLASWASIFTGKQPNETGIMGNEYFARDLIGAGISVPDIYNPPAGMVSYDSGSLKGFDTFGTFAKSSSDFFVPSNSDPLRTPQNTTAMLKPETVFESVSAMPGVAEYYEKKGGDPAVSVLFHYARGAKWVTYSVLGLPTWFHFGDDSKTLDDMGWEGLESYLNATYRSDPADEMRIVNRNDVPFSALTAWYLPGLDHDAHFNGMDGYAAYFKNTTDKKVLNLVNKLKALGEFDNKIFIVVADHGHTPMPVEGTWTEKHIFKNEDGEIEEIRVFKNYDKCEFNTKMTDSSVRIPETLNNNLHIWELAEMLRIAGEMKLGEYKVLTPGVISNTFIKKDASGKVIEVPYGATDKDSKANVIAALNGPMAHIYLKDGDWKNVNTNINSIVKLAGLFSAFLKDGAVEATSISKLGNSIDFILVRESGVYKLLNDVTLDLNGNVINRDIRDIEETEITATFDTTKYVKAKKRIEGLNSIRSGDIVLVFKDDMFGNVVDRYTSGVACKSWHASLNPSDSYVPLIVSYPGGSNDEVCTDAEHKCANLDIKGNWDVPAIIKSVLERQF